jgi:DNA polymerase-3 subunit gamma/tau
VAPRGAVTLDGLRQAWPNVVEAVKAARGRVAWMVIGNASVASFDEGVLTIRFPRQGDVKGFQGGKYEDVLKQVLNTMFGINVVIRAVTGGGDAPSGGSRRPGGPPSPAPPASGQQEGTAWPGSSGAPGPQSPGPRGQAPGQPSGGPRPDPVSGGTAGPVPAGSVPAGSVPAGPVPAGSVPAGPVPVGPVPLPAVPAAGVMADGSGGATPPFGGPVSFGGGDPPPLPPPPPPDDEDFDPDNEDMSVPVLNELTGMALVQRELGGQVIAEYED